MSVEKKIEDLSLNEEIIGLYDAEQEDRRVYNTKLLYATEQATKKGLEQGLEQGLKQGSRNEKNYNIPISVDMIRRRQPIK